MTGIRPLRSDSGPERYGLADLDSEEKETVRIGTARIIRSAEGLQIFLDKGPLED